MGQGKLGRGTQRQHKKATSHSSPFQNEQHTTGGKELLHIYDDTRGAYQYSAGILVPRQIYICIIKTSGQFLRWADAGDVAHRDKTEEAHM